MTIYFYYNVGMYNITMHPYSDYCTVLMLSVYKYGYYTRRIYIVVAFSYPVGLGVTVHLLQGDGLPRAS